MTRMLATLALLCLALPACEKKETPATSTATPAASGAAPVAAASAQASDDGEGMPIEEDFEDEAEQKISAQNADEELDKLEKEISE